MNPLLSATNTCGDKLLDELVDELTRRVQQGESVALEDYACRYPLYGDRLPGLLACIRLLAELASSAPSDVAGTPPTTITRSPPNLGDFRLVREIGHGGMGVVYEAEQISLGRRVAVKILPYASLWSETAIHRFQQEVRLAAMLEHPHIVPIYAVGCERDIHFYAMKLIDGCSLADVIRRRQSSAAQPGLLSPIGPIGPIGPISPDALTYAEWGRSAASALSFAHQRGVIHRDIKPSNLLLDRQGRLYIADFGLARSGNDPNLTRTGDLLGTPRYMSPEQASGTAKLVDERTDIYGLGATLYELLTLQPVVRAAGRAAAIRELQDLQVIAPRTIDPKIPQPLEQIVLMCLHADPVDRYASAAELVEDLDRYLAGQPVLARSPGIVRRTSRWLQRHPQMTLATMIALIAISLISTFSFWMSRHGWLGSAGQRGPPASELADFNSSSTNPPNFSSPKESPDMLRSKTILNSNNRFKQNDSSRRLGVERLEPRLPLAVNVSIAATSATEGDGTIRFVDEFITASGSLNGPHGLTYGPDGALYVANEFGNSVSRFDAATGAPLPAPGKTGSEFVSPGSGGLEEARMLTFGPLGDLYVVSELSAEVLRYNGSTGEFVGAHVASGTGGLHHPKGLLFHGGFLYVTCIRDPDGGLDAILRFDELTGEPAGISGMPGDAVFIPDGDHNLDNPGQIIFHDGFFYVASTAPGTKNSVVKYTTSGEWVEDYVPTGAGGLSGPTDMEFAPDGSLYVVSWANDRVIRYDHALGTSEVVAEGTGLDVPVDIVLRSDGTFLVTSRETNQIRRYGPSSLAAFVVSLNTSSGTPVTVDFATADGVGPTGAMVANNDYFAASGTVTFAPGQTSRTIFVQTRDDVSAESTETFTVTLSNANGAIFANGQTTISAIGTILDNDPFTKFYVVNDGTTNSTDQTFRYQATGQAIGSATGLGSGNSMPRGVASNAAGDRVWVVDDNSTSKKVYVYDTNGALLGNWTAGSLSSTAQVEGITTNGTDVWIVDNKADRVYRYANAAGILSGTVTSADSFPLNNNNKNPKDIVTDGTSLWVVNDAGTDKVFKYMLGGFFLGSWTVTAGGGSPTGITLDPSGGQQHLWIVDNSTDRVYQYDNARSRTSGSQASSTTFVLAPLNTNPQGIADPPIPGGGREPILSGNLASEDQLLNVAWVPSSPPSATTRDTLFGQLASTRDEPDDPAWIDDLLESLKLDQHHHASQSQTASHGRSIEDACVLERGRNADNDEAITLLDELLLADLLP